MQLPDFTEGPCACRPLPRRDQANLMAKIDNPARESLQISFRAAGGGIAAADKANREFLFRHSILILASDHSTIQVSTSRKRIARRFNAGVTISPTPRVPAGTAEAFVAFFRPCRDLLFPDRGDDSLEKAGLLSREASNLRYPQSCHSERSRGISYC